ARATRGVRPRDKARTKIRGRRMERPPVLIQPDREKPRPLIIQVSTAVRRFCKPLPIPCFLGLLFWLKENQPGFTHHFFLGFLGFSWKIYHNHIILHK